MRAFRRFTFAAVLLLLAVTQVPSARAEMLLSGGTQMINGTQTYTLSFVAPSSGTLSVELAAIPWSERVGTITNLSVAMTSATELLGNALASEPLQFSVGGPGALFAHISGTVQGGLEIGLFSVRITFTPSAVPLPAAAWLLTSALGFFFCLPILRSRRNESVTYDA